MRPTEFGRLCEGWELGLNVEEKGMGLWGEGVAPHIEVEMNGHIVEVLSYFVYLGSCFCNDCGLQEDVTMRVRVRDLKPLMQWRLRLVSGL